MKVHGRKLSACIPVPAPSPVPTHSCTHGLGSLAPCCRVEAALQHLLVTPLVPLCFTRTATETLQTLLDFVTGSRDISVFEISVTILKKRERREGVGWKQNPDGERERCLVCFWFKRAFFFPPELKLVAFSLQPYLYGADALMINDVPSGSEKFNSDPQILVSPQGTRAFFKTDPLITHEKIQVVEHTWPYSQWQQQVWFQGVSFSSSVFLPHNLKGQSQLLLLDSLLNFPDDISHNDVSFHVVSITLQYVT